MLQGPCQGGLRETQKTCQRLGFSIPDLILSYVHQQKWPYPSMQFQLSLPAESQHCSNSCLLPVQQLELKVVPRQGPLLDKICKGGHVSCLRVDEAPTFDRQEGNSGAKWS